MWPHHLVSFKLQRYCQNKSDFDSVYARKYLPNMRE